MKPDPRRLTITENAILAALEAGPVDPFDLLAMMEVKFETVNKAVAHLKELGLVREVVEGGKVMLEKVE